jgi:hypothetical protein
MIEPIRLATQEEVEEIAKGSDLTPLCRVVAFEKNLAVLRPTFEVDPIWFHPDSPAHKRALMMWGLEQYMRGLGLTEYYFNILVENTEFQEQVTKFGSEKVSPGAEFRYKKVL